MKRTAAAALLLSVLLPGAAARATTYKMMSDANLADAASAIAQVRVTSVEASPVSGKPSTDYLVEIEKLVKGFVPGSTLVVRVPGGAGTNGLGLKIWGAPVFRSGERALLFLAPHAEDGTYRVVQMMLGAFHVVERGGARFAVRDLSEAQELVGNSKSSELRAGSDPSRNLGGFVRWLEDRAAGQLRSSDYLTSMPTSGALEGNFTYLLPDDGFAIRWFRFDTGLSTRWRIHQGAQPGIPLALAIDSFQVAAGVWNNDSSSNINYAYDGTTSASNGLGDSDNTNTLLFNDPGDQVQGSFDCDTGGVIAAGGPFFFNSTREHRGTRYHEAVEADIVTNDGTDCFFANDPKTVQEILGHELGHTLGLGHSRERQALMFANAHADGRGASLSQDDRDGVAVLYGDGSTPPPPPPPAGLKAPSALSAQILSSTSVKVTWKDNATIEEQVLVERKRIGGSWRQVLALPANTTTATVTGLTPGKPFAFRVRVKKGTAFSPYSETVRTANLPTR